MIFVNRMAEAAEEANHHPDIEIHYWEITLRYWTHTANGVTALDVEGAKEAEPLVALFLKEPALT